MKGDRLALITDQIDIPPSGAVSFGSGRVIDDGTALRLEDGRLAGSRLDLDAAVSNVRRFAGWSLLEAIRACTLVPARILGMESERGTLRAGARADFAVLDAAGVVRETWIGGVRVYDRDPPRSSHGMG
jgi:N-acetylglucosamine-6-phosphate deacetylase